MIQPLALAFMLSSSPLAAKDMALILPPGDSDLQRDLNALYAYIDKEIRAAKARGQHGLLVNMEDPEFSEKGFSEGMQALLSMLGNHYKKLGYIVSFSQSGHSAVMRLRWGIEA